ncbi:nuclease-related domain-containing protein [uncultured Draconibacterium sp.]|uniref:nuclease-related domain-containing protein n=1 Tax=uncultured Draconibacterium sp. TaxID=1573823 RepID=UPI003216653F
MIAEIHHKISSSGSNLSDRLEDKLTGDVFGHLRYLPYELGLKPVLQACLFSDESANSFKEVVDKSNSFMYKFWPHHNEGEPDLILESETDVILIEVKYHSGLSSDDDIEDPELSKNQLSREARILEQIKGNKNAFLIFLATKKEAAKIYYQTRDKILPGVSFGYLSWTSLYEALREVQQKMELIFPSNIIIDDTLRLLKRKGFERFIGFNTNTRQVTKEAFEFNRTRKITFSFHTNQEVNTNYYEFR